jgi:hypothetical protein
VLRTLTFTVMLGAGACAGCGTATPAGYNSSENLLTTTARPAAAEGERGAGRGGASGPLEYKWELVAEYECPTHRDRGSWRQPATDEVVCRRCTDNGCLPVMVEMHRSEHDVTAVPDLAQVVPTSASPTPDAPAGR